MLKYITWLLNDSELLHLKGGFWFITMPIISIIIYSKYIKWKREKEEEINTEYLPTENIILNLSKEEKWMLNKLINNYGLNLDNYIRNNIKKL